MPNLNFINQRENRKCEWCDKDIEVGEKVHLENDVLFVCESCADFTKYRKRSKNAKNI